MIVENIREIQNNIRIACEKSGRNYKDVTLLCVSKTKPAEMIAKAYDYGMREFGENKVQELCEKSEMLPKDIKWHMIGHLQRNKVKYLIGKTELIHSVDSLRLAEEISKESVKRNYRTNILVEVNAAGEETKFGISPAEAEIFVEKIAGLPGIYVKGLMTIAPFVDNPEDNRKFFRNLRKLSIDITNKHIDNVNMSILSMGMTGDYMVAIEEGATHVRVGTGIFGVRNYKE